MKNKAFTLVEILVVVSITMILGFVSLSSFFHFTHQQEIHTNISLFQNTIDALDRKIKNKDIFDYKIILKPGKQNYQIIENIYDTQTYMTLSDSLLQLQNASDGDRLGMKLYKEAKLQTSTGVVVLPYDTKREKNYNYKIYGFLTRGSGDDTITEEINTISLNNFETKIDNISKSSYINLQELHNGGSPKQNYSEIILQNISGKKSMLDKDGQIIDNLVLVFEKDGKGSSIDFEF